MDKQFNTPIVTWKFIPKDFTNSYIKLIIIDEAWMVPRSFRKYIEDTGRYDILEIFRRGDNPDSPELIYGRVNGDSIDKVKRSVCFR